jgi:L-aspartate oxidase
MASCDILIIGAGIAGLSLAIKLNHEFPDRRIVILSKEDETQSGTWHAQGGISVVCKSNDSFESHVNDTLNAGAGLCRRDVVERVIRHAPQVLRDLMDNGAEFDRDASGHLAVGKEGGHSQPRIVHCKDMTGFHISTSLLKTLKSLSGIELLTHHVAVDLITSGLLERIKNNASTCYGALVFNKKKRQFENLVSRATILATGGVGHLYQNTTNPSIATGDGIAMAYRAGALISNMEFIQFHPTAFFLNDEGAPHFLITEALRGHGAYMVNHQGERFMFNYDARGELACRDVVSRAIEDQIVTSGHPCVYLDCRHLDARELAIRFPTVYNHCADRGIDIATDPIPVVPAAHYLCGGIDVDASAMSSVRNLYAIGECAHTGLHGANRLASNSLLEAAVFAGFCFESIKSTLSSIPLRHDAMSSRTAYSLVGSSPGLTMIRSKVRQYMSRYAGVTRTTDGLLHALNYFSLLSIKFEDVYSNSFSPELNELRNAITCARLIIKQSLERNANAGTFYNKDLNLNLTSPA